MAVETLTVQSVAATGAQLNLQSVTTADGFRFKNDGHTLLVVQEQNTANCEVTVTPTVTVDGLAVATRTVDVLSGQMWVLGPWAPEQYNDSDGYLDVGIEADQASAVCPVSVR
jgi:hypothetical protein